MSTYITQDPAAIAAAEQVALEHGAFAEKVQAVRVVLGFGTDENIRMVQVGRGGESWIGGIRVLEGPPPTGWVPRDDGDDALVPDTSTPEGMEATRVLATLGRVPSLRAILPAFGMPAIVESVQVTEEEGYRSHAPAVDLNGGRLIVKWRGFNMNDVNITVSNIWEHVL